MELFKGRKEVVSRPLQRVVQSLVDRTLSGELKWKNITAFEEQLRYFKSSELYPTFSLSKSFATEFRRSHLILLEVYTQKGGGAYTSLVFVIEVDGMYEQVAFTIEELNQLQTVISCCITEKSPTERVLELIVGREETKS